MSIGNGISSHHILPIFLHFIFNFSKLAKWMKSSIVQMNTFLGISSIFSIVKSVARHILNVRHWRATFLFSWCEFAVLVVELYECDARLNYYATIFVQFSFGGDDVVVYAVAE